MALSTAYPFLIVDTTKLDVGETDGGVVTLLNVKVMTDELRLEVIGIVVVTTFEMLLTIGALLVTPLIIIKELTNWDMSKVGGKVTCSMSLTCRIFEVVILRVPTVDVDMLFRFVVKFTCAKVPAVTPVTNTEHWSI